MATQTLHKTQTQTKTQKASTDSVAARHKTQMHYKGGPAPGMVRVPPSGQKLRPALR